MQCTWEFNSPMIAALTAIFRDARAEVLSGAMTINRLECISDEHGCGSDAKKQLFVVTSWSHD